MVLSCRNLRMSFRSRVAVDGLSLSLGAGEAYGLVGPAGAGKSTTLRLACGLLRPEEGEVTLDGRPVTRPQGLSTDSPVGYVPQGPGLLPGLSVRDNLRFRAGLYGLPRHKRAERIEAALVLVGVEGGLSRPAEHCTEGLARRLGLAMALLHRPRLLLLDEPTAGIDAESRAWLVATLVELRDAGTAILLASRQFGEVAQVCDRVGVLDDGRLVVEAEPGGLLASRPELADLRE